MPRDYKATSNTKGMLEAAAERAEEIQKYKKIAANAAKGNRYGQDYAAIMRDNIAAYIKEQQENRRPLTVAGIEKASGLTHDTFARYRNGEADYKLYKYIEDHNIDPALEGMEITDENGRVIFLERMSEIIKNALACIQEQLEANCYTNKGNPAGSIFGLKASFGWQDTPAEQRNTTNNTLVLNNVATLEEAEAAFKRLKG